MISIEDFCDKFGACNDGRKWAIDNCEDMQEVWKESNSSCLLWIATRPGVLDDKTLRLFACFCARQVWHLMTDERSRNAVVVAEKFALGEASKDELSAAWKAALDASWKAASRAAMDASWAAVNASWNVARAAAMDASRNVARAAGDAAIADAEEKQAAWLRANANPNFELSKQ